MKKRSVESKKEPAPKAAKYAPKYWSKEGKHQKVLNAIFDSKLVPVFGPSPDRTLNWLLEWNRLYYRVYNDGEVFDVRDPKAVKKLCKILQLEIDCKWFRLTFDEEEVLDELLETCRKQGGSSFDMEDPALASFLDKVMDWLLERLLKHNDDVKKLMRSVLTA